MNNVIDEVLAGSPRYNIKDNGGTTLYSNVQIDLATQVTTAGTPLNKALFDSIQTDLNSRLLVSNKASQAEAQAGSNDTKYMTPLKVQQKLNSLITTSSFSAGTSTIINFANYTNAKIITISGHLKNTSGSNTSYLQLNGSSIEGYTLYQGNASTISNANSVNLNLAFSNLRDHSFELRFDMASKVFLGNYYDKNDGFSMIQGTFSALTNLQTRLYSSATMDVTIQANS